MADKPKSLLEGGGNALGEGAARFDRLIESVRVQQAPQKETPAPPPANPLLSVGPQEAWTRQFQSQAIGPELSGLARSDYAAVPRDAFMPRHASDILPAKSADIAPDRTAEVVVPPSAPGGDLRPGRQALAERPRRSWLARLFAGK